MPGRDNNSNPWSTQDEVSAYLGLRSSQICAESSQFRLFGVQGPEFGTNVPRIRVWGLGALRRLIGR